MKKIFNTFRAMLCVVLLLAVLALNKAHAEIAAQGNVYLGTMLFQETVYTFEPYFYSQGSYTKMSETFKSEFEEYAKKTKKGTTDIIGAVESAVKHLQDDDHDFNKGNKDNIASYNLIIFTDGDHTIPITINGSDKPTSKAKDGAVADKINEHLSGKPITSYVVSVSKSLKDLHPIVLAALRQNKANNSFLLDNKMPPNNLLTAFLDIAKPAFNEGKIVIICFLFDCSISIRDKIEVAGSVEKITTFFERELPLRMAGMQFTPGGSFVMGSSETGRREDETPDQVKIAPFYMCDHEVTQGEYSRLMGSDVQLIGGEEWENLPITNVSWFDAIKYCNIRSEKEGFTRVYNFNSESLMVTWDKTANGYRLPTEAEWEWAARAATTGPFYTGHDINTDAATFNQVAPIPIKRHNPNQFGYYDMAGSVSEWTFSRYKAYPYDDSTSADLKRWPYRVFRDGNWATLEENKANLRSAARDYRRFDEKSGYVGFRVVRNGGDQK
jgi:formylglycine-generating enzyme required for sulfatase activity